jgi:hypothetical protein
LINNLKNPIDWYSSSIKKPKNMIFDPNILFYFSNI